MAEDTGRSPVVQLTRPTSSNICKQIKWQLATVCVEAQAMGSIWHVGSISLPNEAVATLVYTELNVGGSFILFERG